MKLWMLLMTLLFVGSVSGCNTISGAGQDVQAAGEAVEDIAEETKDELTDDDNDDTE